MEVPRGTSALVHTGDLNGNTDLPSSRNEHYFSDFSAIGQALILLALIFLLTYIYTPTPACFYLPKIWCFPIEMFIWHFLKLLKNNNLKHCHRIRERQLHWPANLHKQPGRKKEGRWLSECQTSQPISTLHSQPLLKTGSQLGSIDMSIQKGISAAPQWTHPSRMPVLILICN